MVRLAGLGMPGCKIYTPNAFYSMNPFLSRVLRKIYGQIERVLSYLSDMIIVVSEAERLHARELGIPAKKLMHIPNGVEPVDLPDRKTARAQFNFAEGEFVIGFVGRLEEQKAPHILFQAVGILIKQFPQVKIMLAIVGEGKLRGTLLDMARDLGMENRVRELGPLNGFFKMPAFDILTLSSAYEGMPYVLIEALFAGLPIVASRLGSTGMIVDSGVNGYLVPPGNVAEFAQALSKLVVSPEKCLQFGRASLKKSKSFTLQTMGNKTLALYQQLKCPESDLI